MGLSFRHPISSQVGKSGLVAQHTNKVAGVASLCRGHVNLLHLGLFVLNTIVATLLESVWKILNHNSGSLQFKANPWLPVACVVDYLRHSVNILSSLPMIALTAGLCGGRLFKLQEIQRLLPNLCFRLQLNSFLT